MVESALGGLLAKCLSVSDMRHAVRSHCGTIAVESFPLHKAYQDHIRQTCTRVKQTTQMRCCLVRILAPLFLLFQTVETGTVGSYNPRYVYVHYLTTADELTKGNHRTVSQNLFLPKASSTSLITLSHQPHKMPDTRNLQFRQIIYKNQYD